MKVLITGGFGFIGSHVVNKFYKEGHEIFIIDNMSSGKVENIICKHKAYKIDVEDKKCKEIFKNNLFDIVVHLAAQINVNNSIENPFVDTKSNILGIVNMLELSAKYKVRKFIFASSATVYGDNLDMPLKEESFCNPMSPYGINKLLGEEYCKKWYELYNLETVCLRLSNVYGERQGTIGEGGVISTYMENLIKNHEITVFGDGTQTRDFIFVSDIAECMFRASESHITGVYNLSTNTQSSINEVIAIINEFHGIKGILKKELKQGDIKHSCLDNTKIKKELDWIPLHSLEDGLKKTYNWYVSNYSNDSKKVAKGIKYKVKRIPFLKKAIPYIENISMFALVFFLSKFLKQDSAFKIVDLKLIYVVLIGITYGTNQSIIASFLASAALIYEIAVSGRELILLVFDTSFILQISAYILVGMVVGYTIDKRERQSESSRVKIESLDEKYEFLQELYNETYKEKFELHNQILNSDDSFGKIYGIIRNLDSLEPQSVYKSAIEVLENILKTNVISIYTVGKTGKFLRLAVNSRKEGFLPQKTITSDYFLNVKDKIFNGEIFVNIEMNKELPMLIAPIVNENETIAVIMIHDVKFEQLSLYYINLFKVVSSLITAAIVRSTQYENAIDSERYIENTIFLRSEFLNNILDIRLRSMNENRSEFSAIKIENGNKSLSKLSSIVEKCIRDTDFAGVGHDEQVYLILSNSSDKDATRVLKRLDDHGINSKLCSGADVYV